VYSWANIHLWINWLMVIAFAQRNWKVELCGKFFPLSNWQFICNGTVRKLSRKHFRCSFHIEFVIVLAKLPFILLYHWLHSLSYLQKLSSYFRWNWLQVNQYQVLYMEEVEKSSLCKYRKSIETCPYSWLFVYLFNVIFKIKKKAWWKWVTYSEAKHMGNILPHE